MKNALAYITLLFLPGCIQLSYTEKETDDAPVLPHDTTADPVPEVQGDSVPASVEAPITEAQPAATPTASEPPKEEAPVPAASTKKVRRDSQSAPPLKLAAPIKIGPDGEPE